MRNVGIFVVLSLVSGIGAVVGCSSNSGGGTGGSTGTTTSSHSSTSTSSTSSTTTSSSGAGGTAGAGGGAGGSVADPFECTIPATPPSAGSCVTYVKADGGGELDAGVDDGGNASETTCNPVTNAGCTGTDVCGPDAANKYYFCQPAGSPAGLKACGDCSSNTATCGSGALCIGLSSSQYVCAQMCCTAADCGGTAKCDTTQLQTALPSGVGLCIP